MDARVVYLVLMLSCSIIFSYINGVEGGRKLSKKEDMEFERQLKLLNKPAVMSIKTEYGDIYDCVDFYKQPAFDHPLSFPKGVRKNGASLEAKPLSIGLKGGGCPFGTVPIRRTTKDDLRRAKSFSEIYAGNMGTLTKERPGYHVNPTLYGDNLTRLYTHWAAGEAGCYNTQCPGFIIVNTRIPIDLVFQKTSVSGGEQIEMGFFIYQDEKNGNWWLNLGINGIPIGYWPKRLFTNLAVSGFFVGWGGEVVSPPDLPSPPMGAGLVHVDDPAYAAYCRQIMLVNEAHQSIRADHTIMYGDVHHYYDLNDVGDEGIYWGHYLMYGGPGGYKGD
ncbi:hypothetical protein HHK36_028899 [Tetracentron sinense]|uniref:Neprosin PEP catalytic domain-containing protein n=1 Tax=Tetracentron sinense TaxID=13715 RepID=A0A834YC02_TETSI|nr:hypothetical protein HHK36_028899 [Tetracentron sinense]